MKRIARVSAVATLALISACAQIPTGPSVGIMPLPGKPFDVFQQDDQTCRAYASKSAGANANDASAESLLGSAVVGTALGAAAGALVGGGRAVAGGAAIGAVAGTAVGVNEASKTGRTVQQRYDIAYEQCMYAHGDALPGQSVSAYLPPPPPQ